MLSNRSIMEKADLAVADLISDGGYLQPMEANRFIQKLMLQADLMGDVRVVGMNSPRMNINKIFFNKRIMRKGTSNTALAYAAADVDTAFDPGTGSAKEGEARAKVKTEQITLLTHEKIAEVHVPYDAFEDVIESGSLGARTDVGGEALVATFKDTVLTLMGKRAAADLQELALLGDTALSATDDYLGMLTGWIKNAETNGNIYDADGKLMGTDVFKEAMKMLPEQYRADTNGLRWIPSSNQEIELRYRLSQRQTGLGDANVTGAAPIFINGAPVKKASHMPQAKMLLTMPKNLIWGVQRQIMVEYEKDIRARNFIFVMTIRSDFQIEEASAVVIVQNIATP